MPTPRVTGHSCRIEQVSTARELVPLQAAAADSLHLAARGAVHQGPEYLSVHEQSIVRLGLPCAREQCAERGSYVGCIAGALSLSEYENGLRAAGLEDISVTFTHEVVDGMHGAIVKATKPV